MYSEFMEDMPIIINNDSDEDYIDDYIRDDSIEVEKDLEDKDIKENEKLNKKIEILEAKVRFLESLNDCLENYLLDSVPKYKIKNELYKANKENEPYEKYNKESRAYWINQGKINLAKKILEEK